MDEIEFKQLYNHACDAVDRINAPEIKTAMLSVLQLVWDVHERLVEMQVEEDDDE
jgi:hypothetical protein